MILTYSNMLWMTGLKYFLSEKDMIFFHFNTFSFSSSLKIIFERTIRKLLSGKIIFYIKEIILLNKVSHLSCIIYTTTCSQTKILVE